MLYNYIWNLVKTKQYHEVCNLMTLTIRKDYIYIKLFFLGKYKYIKLNINNLNIKY